MFQHTSQIQIARGDRADVCTKKVRLKTETLEVIACLASVGAASTCVHCFIVECKDDCLVWFVKEETVASLASGNNFITGTGNKVFGTSNSNTETEGFRWMLQKVSASNSFLGRNLFKMSSYIFKQVNIGVSRVHYDDDRKCQMRWCFKPWFRYRPR